MNNTELAEGFEKLGNQMGANLYWAFNEDQQVILSYGMFPEESRKEMELWIRTRVALAMTEKGFPCERENVHKEIVDAFLRGVVLGAMQTAKSLGRMIV